MTFEQIVQAAVDRGFDYQSTARMEDWVQRAYQQLTARYRWPWSEKTKEGKSSLEIKDLRYVLSVEDAATERPLWGATRQWLTERYPDLAEEGEPLWWWLDNKTLKTFPTSSANTIEVRYVFKPEALKGSEEPLIPDEWRYLLVDMVVVECLKDNRQLGEARELKEMVREGMQEMIVDQLQRDFQSSPLIVRTGRDYL